jgi:hypothetical protein
MSKYYLSKLKGKICAEHFRGIGLNQVCKKCGTKVEIRKK